MSTEQIHEQGAKRHRSRWLAANQRAVDVLMGSTLRSSDAEVKKAISLIILRVLDGTRLDAGEVWDSKAERWLTRAEVELRAKAGV